MRHGEASDTQQLCPQRPAFLGAGAAKKHPTAAGCSAATASVVPYCHPPRPPRPRAARVTLQENDNRKTTTNPGLCRALLARYTRTQPGGRSSRGVGAAPSRDHPRGARGDARRAPLCGGAAVRALPPRGRRWPRLLRRGRDGLPALLPTGGSPGAGLGGSAALLRPYGAAGKLPEAGSAPEPSPGALRRERRIPGGAHGHARAVTERGEPRRGEAAATPPAPRPAQKPAPSAARPPPPRGVRVFPRETKAGMRSPRRPPSLPPGRCCVTSPPGRAYRAGPGAVSAPLRGSWARRGARGARGAPGAPPGRTLRLRLRLGRGTGRGGGQ